MLVGLEPVTAYAMCRRRAGRLDLCTTCVPICITIFGGTFTFFRRITYHSFGRFTIKYIPSIVDGPTPFTNSVVLLNQQSFDTRTPILWEFPGIPQSLPQIRLLTFVVP